MMHLFLHLLAEENTLLVYFLVVNTFYFLLLLLSLPRILKAYYHTTTDRRDMSTEIPNHFGPLISIVIVIEHDVEKATKMIKQYLHQFKFPIEFIPVIAHPDDAKFNWIGHSLDLQPALPKKLPALPSRAKCSYFSSKIYPEIMAIRMEEACPYESYNAAISCCRASYFLALSDEELPAASVLEKSLKSVMLHEKAPLFKEGNPLEPNQELIAIHLPKFSFPHITIGEYFRHFAYNILRFTGLKDQPIIPETYTIWNTAATLQAGGYQKTCGYSNIDLTLRIFKEARKASQQHQLYTEFIPEGSLYADTTPSLLERGREKEHEQKHTMEVALAHKDMLFNSNYSWLGCLSLPFYFLSEALDPFIEAFAYYFVIAEIIKEPMSWYIVLLTFLASCVFSSFFIIIPYCVETLLTRYPIYRLSLIKYIIYTIASNIIYRQWVFLWRLKGVFSFFYGKMKQRRFAKKNRSLTPRLS
ncbi:MAG: glycosyl transferase family 2 [Chlamydiales bacterium]|jgi:hypothetical protein|nr:glycosyl transferase family 2 [Chlamydiales bacterium]